MTFEAIQAVAQAGQSDAAGAADLLAGLDNARTSAAGSGFANIVDEGLGAVNQQLLASQTDLQQLATGNIENLHQVMIRLEESQLSFQFLLQVRNRVLEAYQDVMKMQV